MSALIFIFSAVVFIRFIKDVDIKNSIRIRVSEIFTEAVSDSFIPLCTVKKGQGGILAQMTAEGVKNLIPVYGYGEDTSQYIAKNIIEIETGTEDEQNNDTNNEMLSGISNGMYNETENHIINENNGIVNENEIDSELQTEYINDSGTIEFTPHEITQGLDLTQYKDYDALVKRFYTIDNNTMADDSLLNVDKFEASDMRIEKNSEEPQILIYHTHSQEGYADSVPGDDSTTIMGVGERLASILEERYGYNVLHHMGKYDVETRDEAYSNALPDIEKVLSDNPSIQVVIDLHRDEMAEDTRLVTEVDGRPTAKFMFFNGLSRTKKTGEISYLKNDNLMDNLAFSFKMQLAAEIYYPGTARKIYLKSYRYNMHLKPKTLLIELGAQNNTLEEAMNACDIIAHLLDLVLTGEVE
jgi:stage II sporulation protein P